MQYTVYLQGPGTVTWIVVESDEAPNLSADEDESGFFQFGGMSFRRRDLMAIIPAEKVRRAATVPSPRQ